jgi:hypothetical protein
MPIARDLAFALKPSRFVQGPQKFSEKAGDAGFAAIHTHLEIEGHGRGIAQGIRRLRRLHLDHRDCANPASDCRKMLS